MFLLEHQILISPLSSIQAMFQGRYEKKIHANRGTLNKYTRTQDIHDQ